MPGTWCKGALVVCLLVLVLGRAAGQSAALELSELETPPDYDKFLAKQPPGLRLKLTLPKDHFYQGEVIHATLTYTNTGKDAREVELNEEGHLDTVRFFGRDAHGTAVADPIAWCSSPSGGGAMDLKSLHDGSSASVTLPMNEWLRFDHPGTYTVFAISAAVQSDQERFPRQPGLDAPLISDKVTITITPLDPEEEKRVIARATQAIAAEYRWEHLSDVDRGRDERESQEEMLAHEADIAALRYLQTPAARAGLRAGLDKNPQYQMHTELLGAPDRPAEAALILADVRAGRLRIDENLTRLYAKLKTYPQSQAYYAGMRHVLTPEDNERLKLLERAWETADATAQAEILAAAKEAAAKTGVSDLHLIWTAFLTGPGNAAYREAAAAHQLEFSQSQQLEILRLNQPWFDVPPSPGEREDYYADFLPVVRRHVGSPEYNLDAFKILTKARPDEARALLIEDLRNVDPHYLREDKGSSAVWDLLKLPAGPIPELEEPLRALLGRQPGAAIQLIERYGTPALLPDLLRVYRQVSYWEANEQPAALRFWLRTDPAAGLAGLKQALEDRGSNQNYQDVLHSVLTDVWLPGAMPLVLQALQDPSHEMVRSAMMVLLDHGDETSVRPILEAVDRLPPTERSSMGGSLLWAKRWTWTPEQKQRLEDIAEGKR